MDWKPIPSYPDYEASNTGEIRRVLWNGFPSRPPRILKQTNSGKGYKFAFMCCCRKQILVHILVADAWLEKVEGCDTIDHINGKRDDNRVENLRRANRRTQRHNSRSRIEGKEKWIHYDKNRDRWQFVFRLENGKRHYKIFSVKKYGEKARDLACEYRNKYLEENGILWYCS